MKVLNRTPRTDLRYGGYLRKMAAILEQVAQENGTPIEAADDALEGFAWLSSRVEFETGEVDFDLARTTDTAEEIKVKFDKYLDTESMRQVNAARVAIREKDRPADPVNAPVPPKDAEGK